MNIYRVGIVAITLSALAACGKPDASGIYVHSSDRAVTFVQLIQTPDGKVTGRLQETTIEADGTVKEKSAAVDGSASDHDLMLRPASAWYGGVQASGTFSRNELTLTGEGFTLNAERSSFEKYQEAVVYLKTAATEERQKIETAREAEATQAAQAQAVQDTNTKLTALGNATNQLRQDTGKLNASITNCPNFARHAAANTARIAKMLKIAPTLTELDRNQLAVEANQIQVETNQIDVERSQYANGLNQIVQDAEPIVGRVQKFCSAPPASQFAAPCNTAKSAIAEFQAAVARGRNAFLPYKQALQTELQRQSAMTRRMGG